MHLQLIHPSPRRPPMQQAPRPAKVVQLEARRQARAEAARPERSPPRHPAA